jgi:TetR/AcrR family transcriptional regulator, regulator of cefoperazone and chloramphenicol sensitivity
MDGPSSRRVEIAAVARQLFVARGYDGTKISDIASALGVSKAAISYHFPTKDSFLDEFVEPFVGRLEQVVAGHEFDRASLTDLVGQLLDVLLVDIEVSRWVDSDLAVKAEHHFGDRLNDINARLVAAITGDDPTPKARICALAVLGGVWRPVLVASPQDLRACRATLLDAAVRCYSPDKP